MKKTLALILAVMLVVALFAGCNNGGTTSGGATTPAADNSTGTNEPAANSGSTESADPEGYNFGKGKVALDAQGFPTEKYEYTTPITTKDDILTFWTVCWMPSLLPESGNMNDLEYAKGQEERTGVHIEYDVVTSDQRQENFSVLLAADDLRNLSASGMSMYSGTVNQAIYDEGYFVNIYDYMDYCPNYIYEAKMRDPSDNATYKDVFYYDNLIYGFMALQDRAMIQMSHLIRADWLDELGISPDSIKTWTDLEKTLQGFQTLGAANPMGMLSVLDMQNSYSFNAYDTLPYVSSSVLPPQFQINNQVQFGCTTDGDKALMEMLNRFWGEDLIYKNWAANTDNSTYHPPISRGEVGYMVTNAVGAKEYAGETDDPDVYWVPLHKLTITEGQTLHVGEARSRKTYGHTVVSTKTENIPLAIAWCDWRYSDAGSFYVSYGPQGLTWDYDDNGEIRLTEFVTNNPDAGMDWVLIVHTINQLAEHGMEDTSRKYRIEGGDELLAMYDVWADFKYDGAYDWPAGLKLNDDQTERVASYSGNVCTYIAENFLAFLDGSKPLNEWDSYIAEVNSIGLDEIRAIYQEALDANA